MSKTERLLLGALGGFSAVLVKFLGQDYHSVVQGISDPASMDLVALKMAYVLLTPILMFLGAFVAWISEEQKRIKVVAVSIAAPAMITTWAGGAKGDVKSSSLGNLVSHAAYAQQAPLPSTAKAVVPPTPTPTPTPAESSWQQIQKGVGLFFGYGKTRYWVIVGSFKNRDLAQAFAGRINAADRTLKAFVGPQSPPNEFYPVIVGGYSPLDEAKVIRERAIATKLVKEAYFSQGSQH